MDVFYDASIEHAVKQCIKIVICTGLKYLGQKYDSTELIWIGSYGQTYFAITCILDLIDPQHTR